MNQSTLVFLGVTAIALLSLPRRWAAMPLLAGACYMTAAQRIVIGPFDFTFLRLLITFGMLRVVLRREWLVGRMHGLDKVLLVWAGWAICSSFFRDNVPDALIFRLGMAFNALGVYFLMRIFCRTYDDIVNVLKITAFLLVPVAIEMFMARITGRNMFSVFGGIPEAALVRHGTIRAQGTFAHPILAGTVGSGCLPAMVGFWGKHRVASTAGILACLVMVFASGSSGPFMSMLAGVFALFMWRYRNCLQTIRWTAVGIYIALDLVMKAPAYYLIARIDILGGGTAYHRARLIDSAFQHLKEWWLAGTDYTRHWMVTGVSWSSDHADITNHYIKLGVIGGLPLMLLFIACIWLAFIYMGNTFRNTKNVMEDDCFIVWSVGASLFSYAATCLAVSFFDQSFMFLYLILAIAGSLQAIFIKRIADESHCMQDGRPSPPESSNPLDLSHA